MFIIKVIFYFIFIFLKFNFLFKKINFKKYKNFFNFKKILICLNCHNNNYYNNINNIFFYKSPIIFNQNLNYLIYSIYLYKKFKRNSIYMNIISNYLNFIDIFNLSLLLKCY
ncbi:hypothetical protein NDNC_0660 [Candidatus Nasuia deltocephalinicola]|uniref:Cytochrome c553 n=1 Tax=Candidatus Nasuia deltocephalincola TaxID=1160784 RepID=A0A974WPF5_9PROT|nr:hypothetical protein CU086_00025 [Candidatus Nasuia deltocephalinicola]BEH03900.1 hypothetical protein NDNC_0660 [Candidatus Nasuia deltocephalinicola]